MLMEGKMKRMAFDRRFVNPAGDGLVEGKVLLLNAEAGIHA
jgi:hypothetical protein